MLHVEQPDARRRRERDHRQLNQQVRLDADGQAHQNGDPQQGSVRPVHAPAFMLCARA